MRRESDHGNTNLCGDHTLNRFCNGKQGKLAWNSCVITDFNLMLSEPLLVLIEYVPYGDLLGYLRKSRGLNDTYYKDPDIKPKTSLTSQQLMKFAWQIADGMSYLSLRKANLGFREGISNGLQIKDSSEPSHSCLCNMSNQLDESP